MLGLEYHQGSRASTSHACFRGLFFFAVHPWRPNEPREAKIIASLFEEMGELFTLANRRYVVVVDVKSMDDSLRLK